MYLTLIIVQGSSVADDVYFFVANDIVSCMCLRIIACFRVCVIIWYLVQVVQLLGVGALVS